VSFGSDGIAVNRRAKTTAVALLLMGGCGQSEPAGNHQLTPVRDDGAGAMHRYIVRIPVPVCPAPEDFHARIDALLEANPTHPLPERCWTLEPGTVVLAEAPGQRPSVEYREFTIEQGSLETGTPFWSDELSGAVLKESAALARSSTPGLQEESRWVSRNM
jgi:hypothetical protein